MTESALQPLDSDIEINTSFLIFGDSGSHKTYFLSTLPAPIVVADFDRGMGMHQHRRGKDMFWQTFKELPKGQTLVKDGKLSRMGYYEYGMAWPAFLDWINAIGRSIDDGTCPYRAIGIDSLTLLADCASTYILKANGGEFKDGRQFWQVFLNNVSAVFSQLTGWPLIKVLTAHVRRMENDLTKVEEKLPLVGGQLSGKISVYFDEVYYVEGKKPPGGALAWTLKTQPDSVVKQVKSRKYNIADGTEASWPAVLKQIKGQP
jgi:hypothetical protein